jgi:hypothetical protein
VLLLDVGAFLAVERNDRDVVALIQSELIANQAPRTHGGIVARLLPGVDVVSLDVEQDRSAGMLLKAARSVQPRART